MLGEVKKVTVKLDGEVVGSRRNTRNYKFAVADKEDKRVVSYHLTEAAARSRAFGVTAYQVVATEVEDHVWEKIGVIYRGVTYEVRTSTKDRVIQLTQEVSRPAANAYAWKSAAKARKHLQLCASWRPWALLAVLPATLAPYREPPQDQCFELTSGVSAAA